MHLESDLVASYLDRTLSAGQRERVEIHLAECWECQSELVAVARLMQEEPRRSRSRWVSAAAVAAAAVIAILVIRAPDDNTRDLLLRGDPQGTGPAAVVQVTPLAPTDRALVPNDGVAVVWHSIEAETLYRLTLLDANGDELWDASTADTIVTLTPVEGLKPGSEYFWYVDALLSEGRQATSGIQRFRTEP